MKGKKTRIALVLSLVAVLIIGATWAALSVKTNTKTNAFTFSGNITAELIEPDWDKDGGGKDTSKNMVPGRVVEKDPSIKNTCSIPEYVAIKLTFRNGNAGATLTPAQMTYLLNCLDFSYGTTDSAGYNPDWLFFTGNSTTDVVQRLYYRLTSPLPGDDGTTQNHVTSAVFDKITLKKTLTTAQIDWLSGKGNAINGAAPLSNGFEIFIEGAAVNAGEYTLPADNDTVIGDLLALINTAP